MTTALVGNPPYRCTRVYVLKVRHGRALVSATTAWHDTGWEPAERWVDVSQLQDVRPGGLKDYYLCGVEQRKAHLAHNQKVDGSSPSPATKPF